MQIQLYKKENQKELVEAIFLMEVQSVGPREVPKHQFCFFMNVRGRTFVLEARSTAERDEWCAFFCESCGTEWCHPRRIATIESATALGKKKKPVKTLIDSDKVAALCLPNPDTLWSVTAQLQLVRFAQLVPSNCAINCCLRWCETPGRGTRVRRGSWSCKCCKRTFRL